MSSIKKPEGVYYEAAGYRKRKDYLIVLWLRQLNAALEKWVFCYVVSI